MRFHFHFLFKARAMILLTAIISSSCGALGGLMLSDNELMATSNDNTHGYKISSSNVRDLNADAGYLYGIWKVTP